MSNKLFFIVAIFGTLLMLLILIPHNQVVDAERLEQEVSPHDVTQIVIAQLKSLLSDSQPITASESLENKIQQLEYKQQVQSEASKQPQKSLEQICKSIMNENLGISKQIGDGKKEGILTVREDFLVPQGYLINNMWHGQYDGYDLDVFSGNLYTDNQKGLVILDIPELNLFKVFSDPALSGSLSITAVDGYRIQLSATNGNILYFDIPSQQFTNDMAKSMSVVDLPAPPTPIADPCAEFNTP